MIGHGMGIEFVPPLGGTGFGDVVRGVGTHCVDQA